ncbi:MAG: UDP-N-acetylmuramoyl-L-alanine--D-glutamate ligase, partial [Helicobacter sp.]|nr:UDP-N-acetylmuramoyl-L-alanine--D-glutamate ligase [Helicobacter sp.]
MSEYDFFSHCMPFSIWISGTNGKSTTTEMLTFLLAHKGAISGGNIGKPLADLPTNAPIWVLETSSFALHYTNRAKPNLYLLLPISEDHISWHSSYEYYVKDKLKPLLLLRDKEIAILPKVFQNHPYVKNSLATPFFYTDSQDIARIFGIDTQRIVFKEPFLLDSLLALSATKILFDALDYDLLNTFKIGMHKMEEFYDGSHRLWIDDSKGTNVDATLEAIKCYGDKLIYLILGGDDKGADLTPLFEGMKNLQISLYAIGSNAKKIASLAQKYKKPCILCYTLDNAVNAIKQVHNLQSVAMLSPAAASLDQFSSYKQRGERFKAYALS